MKSLTFIAVLAQVGFSSAGVLHERQNGCNADNLLRNLQATSHTSAASTYCTGLLCLPTPLPYYNTPVSSPNVATVTTFAHPFNLYNLQGRPGSNSPLTYASPPTPSPVPGGAPCYAWNPNAVCAYTTGQGSCQPYATPTWLSTTYPASRYTSGCSCLLTASTTPGPAPSAPTSTCTLVASGYKTTTIPQFCNPAWMSNAPGFKATGLPTATATATVAAGVGNKIDCCAACADTFNCVAWTYTPATTFTPNNRFPGGFDPYSPGSCKFIYHTGPDVGGNAAAVCPNGAVGQILQGSNNVVPVDATSEFRYENLFFNGWNQGPCGYPANVLQSGQDPGVPSYESLCH